jgi:hypothetical protein
LGVGLTTPPCKTWICIETSTEASEKRKKVGEVMAQKAIEGEYFRVDMTKFIGKVLATN